MITVDGIVKWRKYFGKLNFLMTFKSAIQNTNSIDRINDKNKINIECLAGIKQFGNRYSLPN